MRTTTIELPKQIAAQLAQAAKRLGMSQNRLLQEAVEARLLQAELGRQPSLYDRSRDLCGSVADAPPDLARNKAHLKGYASWKR